MKNKVYITVETYGNSHTFEVVESVPKGYSVWNIGEHMADGYLPLCKIKEGTKYNIERDTLKAIRADDNYTILKGTVLGYETPESMEEYIRRYEQGLESNEYFYNKLKDALPPFKKVKFD